MRQELIRKKEMLLRAKNEAMNLRDNSRVWELKSEINVLLDREVRMWAQRSRLLWASQGDKNIKYFHSHATKRYRKNQIVGIKDGQESWKVDLDEVATIVINYYQQLFTSTRIDLSSCVLNHVPTVITEEMNSSPCREFKEEEVLSVLKQIPLKPSGQDGLPSQFYQHF